MSKDLRFWVCECGAQTPVGKPHVCAVYAQRSSAELIDSFIQCSGDFNLAIDNGAAVKRLHVPIVDDAVGLLWLYRIAFRIRSRMDGLEKFKDRAELARRVCRMLDPVEEYEHEKLGEKK